MALFQKDEFMRPMTLAALAAIVIFVIVLRIQHGEPKDTTSLLSQEEFGQLVNSLYPTDEELSQLSLISLSSRERHSESVHMAARDGYAVQGYISKPEGSGPFPYIIIAPDPFVDVSAQLVSERVGELYATSLRAVVVVIDMRSMHRGVDDVTDVIAAIEWQKKVSEIHDQPNMVVGIGYGAWVIAHAAEVATPQSVAYFSPLMNLQSEDAKTSFLNTFILQSDCENIAAQDVCVSQLVASTIPDLPTYAQFVTGEAEQRNSDTELIAAVSGAQIDVLDVDESLRTALINERSTALTDSFQKFSDWFDAQTIAANAPIE